MAHEDDDERWSRQLLAGLGALAVVALVIGAIVGAVALGVVRATGLGTAEDPGPEAGPSLYIPTDPPTTTPEQYPDPQVPGPTGAASPGAGTTGSAEPSRSPSESPSQQAGISLQAFPGQVGRMQRINLTGVYQQGEGATLQVQRFQNGHWSDFPVTVPVRGGIFETYVMTGRTGKNRFRVYDPGADLASNPVTVRVG